MSDNEDDEIAESHSESGSAANNPELVKLVSEGKQELVANTQAWIQNLKDGGQSGITSDLSLIHI